MSFWKKIFGGDGAAPAVPSADPIEYKGYTIRPEPFQESGQYQTCGTITREIDGTTKSHRLIRADRFASRDEAVDTTVRKARQVIDEQGDRIFG